LLAPLEAGEVGIRPGKEVDRVVQELAGPEIAQMRRELFGDGTTPAKLEYKISEDSPLLKIRFHVTKRKAHSVVGLNTGVCTAADQELWNREEFLEVIFFAE